MLRFSALLLAICTTLSPLMATSIQATETTPQPTLASLLDHMDMLYRSKSAEARVTMHIKTPHFERTMELNMWSEGLDKTFITILSPAKNKGVATLRVNEKMWNYFPNVNKVMTVPPSMMTASWMGSDFTNDDLVKETSLREDYTSALDTNTDSKTYTITLTPRATTASVWGKIVIKMSKDSLQPISQEFFDEKGNAKRIMHFEDVQAMGGRTIPTTMRLENLAKPGQITVVKYVEATFDKPLPDDIFSMRNLRKRR